MRASGWWPLANARRPDVQWRALNARPRLSTVILSLTRMGLGFIQGLCWEDSWSYPPSVHKEDWGARAWMLTTLSPPCPFCGPGPWRALTKMDGTALSLHDLSTSHSPPPSIPVHTRHPTTHPSHWVGVWVLNSPPLGLSNLYMSSAHDSDSHHSSM